MTDKKEVTFNVLRQANVSRIPRFRNKKGELAHNHDGSDWILSQWTNAVLGELGELSNLIKKIERGDFSLEEAHSECAKELADVATYLDILAFRMGVDLGQAIVDKFNEVSDRVNAGVYIKDNSEVIITDPKK